MRIGGLLPPSPASFLSASPWPVKQLGAYEVELSPGALPKATEVWVLEVKR